MEPPLTWLDITNAASGWVLLVAGATYVVRLLLTGKLITRREADALERQIETKDQIILELQTQHRKMLEEGITTTNSVLQALRSAAEK